MAKSFMSNDIEHPVLEPHGLYLATVAQDALKNKLLHWLWTGKTGGYITGPSQTGKSTAILRLANRIQTRHGHDIPVLTVSIGARDVKTIVSVYRQMCEHADLPFKPRDSADLLFKKFIQFVLDQTRLKKSNRFVLFVDEMQLLTAQQCNVFVAVYNRLKDKHDIAFTVILIGNTDESMQLLDSVAEKQCDQLRGRFFKSSGVFSGLTSRADVEHCLNQYDTLRYPSSGPTYTEFFLPEKTKEGWKLASISSELWAGFRRYQLQYDIESWGMGPFVDTVNTLLTDFLPDTSLDCEIEVLIERCIQMSGLLSSQVTE
jgi:hypothetical protein